jgi:hypothetical protein
VSSDCRDHRELGKTRADTGQALLLGPSDRENPAELGRVPARRVVADRLVVAVKHR